MKHIYRTNFNLTYPVNDFDAAYSYLTEDDMTEYLLDDDRGCSKVESIRWELVDEQSGYIEVITNELLTDDEKKNISDWIRGQNSDGLGEGFEQQRFAEYQEEEDWYDEDEDEYYEGEWVSASFDWSTNPYRLTLIDPDDVKSDTKAPKKIVEKYSLVGVDGNAFSVMGYTSKALKETGNADKVVEMRQRAMSGDYWHLIAVCDEYIDLCNKSLEEV